MCVLKCFGTAHLFNPAPQVKGQHCPSPLPTLSIRCSTEGRVCFFFFHFFFPLCPPVSTPAMALLPLLSLIIVQALTHLRLITKLHISSMFTWHPVLCAVYTGNKCIHIIRGCWNCPGAVWTVSLNRDRMFAPGKKKQKTMSSWSLQKT